MTQFHTPPEIEELGDLSWKRVELRVFQELDRAQIETRVEATKKPMWLAGAGALAAVAVVLLLVLKPFSTTPSTTANVTQPSRIVTQSTSSEVVVGDATIEVAPESAIWIDQANDSIIVTLDKGAVSMQVAPRKNRAPVAVFSGKVRVEVMGTRFGVYRSGDDTQVKVFEGVVAVISKGQRDSIAAGETWPSVEERAIARTPKRARVQKRHQKKQRRAEEPEEIPLETSSPRALYEQASELEATSADQAIALYQQVAAGKGPWAALALYAHARLQEAQGNDKEASILLKRYLKKFPEGANAHDARGLLENTRD